MDKNKNVRKLTRQGLPHQIISNKKDVLHLRFIVR